MPYFLCRIYAPSSTFVLDMTESEKALMAAHTAWWMEQTQNGTAVLFGPVFDPMEPWSLGIVEAADEDAARELTARDPVITANVGFEHDIMPMLIASMRSNAG